MQWKETNGFSIFRKQKNAWLQVTLYYRQIRKQACPVPNPGRKWWKMPGGEYSTDAQVGRCSRAAQTLTLFKTQMSDFPTLFKTENFPIFNPKSYPVRIVITNLFTALWSHWAVLYANCANKKLVKLWLVVRFLDIPLKTKKDKIDTHSRQKTLKIWPHVPVKAR